MKVHNCEQQSPEWFEIRKGKMTASHAQAIGNCGKGLGTYIIDLMSSYYSSGENDNYTNKHMERGNELEPIARDMYELETGNTVVEVGFVEIDEYTGYSPDGLVEKEGGNEYKSEDDKAHFEMILNGEKAINSKYIWQVQMCLFLSKRKWWDLSFYNPNFECSLITFRIYPDKEKFEKLKEGLKKGKEMIKEIHKSINY